MLRIALLACLATACATGRNYTDPQQPRFAGTATSPGPRDSLRVVTFNIQFSKNVDAAIALLQEHPQLRDADILALQEMDESGTRQIAAALGLHYVYYPATLHPTSDRDFGNAILARWPIERDRKVLLPHLGKFRKTQRIAVTGRVQVGGRSITVYSLHLATAFEMGPTRRREQAETVIRDADSTVGAVIIAGDLNSHGVGRVFADAGFAWPTEATIATNFIFRWDHIFLKGLRLRTPQSHGVVTETHGASDHRPVWAVVVVDSLGPGAGVAR